MGKNLKGKECGTGICQRKDESLPKAILLFQNPDSEHTA